MLDEAKDCSRAANGGEPEVWFALKVFHNRVFALEAELQQHGIECYVACEQVVQEDDDGRKTIRRRAAVAGLLFVRCRRGRIAEIKDAVRNRAVFYKRDDGEPARIPDREMEMFRLVTSSGDTGLEYLPADSGTMAVGQRVRVLRGPLKGAEGHIKRIRGNRRLVVTVNGLCAVATSYIPGCFLEKLPD